MASSASAWATVRGKPSKIAPPAALASGSRSSIRATTIPVVSFDPGSFERIVAEHHVTVVQGPPTLFHALIERAKEGSGAFGTLRVGVTGAAVIPPALVRDMLDVLGLALVVTAYGLTETTGVCTMTRPGDPIDVVAATSGRPIAGVDVGIYKGSVTPANQIGTVTTNRSLLPGQTEPLTFTVPAGTGTSSDTYVAQVIINPTNPTFHECTAANNTSNPATASCSQ